MAVSELNSLVDLLEKATNLVYTVVDKYKQTSLEIKAFSENVPEYKRDGQKWQQLLRKYPLRQDHPVVKRLEEAVGKLEEQQLAVRAMEVSNCCLRFWKKALSPDHLIDSLRDVDKAFQDILVSLDHEDKKEEERLLQEAVEKAPFSFNDDQKYVPLMETVEKVRKALEGDGSAHVQKVVLVYGASGEGKSTLAKFLAWDYYKKSKGASSSSDPCRFSDGVVFISCKEKTESDSLFLLQKLWEDLGYSPEAPQVRGVQLAATDTIRRIDLENLKRKLISLLRGKSILIILDDVSDDRHVIEDLMVQPEESDVNYLITSQRSNIWSSDEFVHIGTPNTEEARKILANHIVRWDGKAFPTEVQGEVDCLIAEVENHPLVIANLATSIKCEKVSDVSTWIQLKKQLNNAIRAVHIKYQSNTESRICIYGETYNHSAVASLTMAMDQVIDKARSLLLMLAVCTGEGVPENVLRLWFKAVHGMDTFLFNVAFEDLQARSLILITETEVEWSNDPVNICSIHDLRRQLLPEMFKDAVENILDILIGREWSTRNREGLVSSAGSDEDLVAALFFLYGDEKYNPTVQKRFKIHDDLFQDVNSLFRSRREYWLAFVKTIGQLLHPSLEEASDSEKTTHGLAKSVILHFLKSADLEDYPVSKLLEIPDSKTFVATCSALDSLSWCYLPKSIPMTIRNLAEPLRKWADEPPVVVSNLRSCLEAFDVCTWSCPFAVAADLPLVLTKLLQWSSSNSLAKDQNVALPLLFSLLDLCRKRSQRVQLAAVPGMLETLLGLLNSKFHSKKILLEYASETFHILACSDKHIKVRTLLLPDVLNSLVRVLPLVPKSSLESLTKLAWAPKSADSIASCPGALDGIVQLLTNPSDSQSRALLCLGQLASFPSTRTIIASTCPRAFPTHVGVYFDLLPLDGSPPLLRDIANALREVIFDDTGLDLGMSTNFLTKVLEKLDLRLGENVHVTVRSGVVEALEILASKRSICKRLEAHPGCFEQIFQIPAFADTTIECMEFVNSAVREIFVEGKDLEESRRMALVAGAVKMYTTLLQDTNVESGVQRKAAKGLGIICRRSEFCSVVADVGAEQILMYHMRRDPTFYISVEGAHIVENVFLEGAKLSKVGRAIFMDEVLKFYLAILGGGYEVQQRENALQAIALLSYWKEIRQLLVDGSNVQLLLGHVTESASPLILICVAHIIYRVCWTEYDESRRMTLLTRALKTYVALLTEGIRMELREAATESLLILAPRKETQKLLLIDESALDLLLGLVGEDTSTPTLHGVAYLLQNILVKGPEHAEEEVRRMEFMNRAVESFVRLLADGIQIRAQAGALGGLARLAFRQENGEIRVAYGRALNQLIRLMRKVDVPAMLEEVCEVVELVSACKMDAEDSQEDICALLSYALQGFLSVMKSEARANLQESAAWCLVRVLCYEINRKSIFSGGIECLEEFVDGNSLFSKWSMLALTLIDPIKAGKMNLSSHMAFEGRGWARICLEQHKSALEDYDKALELTLWEPALESLLSMRGHIKTELGNVRGALADLNRAIKSVNQRIKRLSPEEQVSAIDQKAFYLQERGIMKSLMLDYEGAMLDLTESLRVVDSDDYETLKNRGYVKLCIGDEDGARFDAEQATCTRFKMCTFSSLAVPRRGCLGILPVKYLEFDL